MYTASCPRRRPTTHCWASAAVKKTGQCTRVDQEALIRQLRLDLQPAYLIRARGGDCSSLSVISLYIAYGQLLPCLSQCQPQPTPGATVPRPLPGVSYNSTTTQLSPRAPNQLIASAPTPG